MKRFLSLFLAVLFLVEMLIFFGAGLLFDFSAHPYLTGGLWALLLAIITYALVMQYEKILALEKRIKELEEQNKSNLT